MPGAAPLSARRAVAVGHAVVSLPCLAVVLGVVGAAWTLLGPAHEELLLAPLAGALIAWPWWALAVPRWRNWALGRGADPEDLQRWGQRTGLLWPRGRFFERLEWPPRG